jgi:hypothetical protein
MMRRGKTFGVAAVVIFAVVFTLFSFDNVSGYPAQMQACKLTASDASAYDYFGFAVSCSGSYIAAGAPYHKGEKSGTVYIFKYDRTNWLEQAKLRPADASKDDCFGLSVSLCGDCVVVGAPNNDVNGIDCGAAYVFKRIGDSWFQQAKLTPADANEGKQFGESVSIWRDYVIVGARYDCQAGDAAGAAYIFKCDNGNWRQQAKLTASEPKSCGQFGWSVAITDGFAIIGAVGADATGYDCGEAYIFRRVGSQWLHDARLLPSSTIADGAGFGFAVSISPTCAVIGAPFEFCGTHKEAGSVYIYRPTQTGWTLEANFGASDCDVADQFGKAVCLDGDRVVVGADLDDIGETGQAGSAYLFHYQGKTWIEDLKLTASDCQSYDRFGASVAISSGCVVAGIAYDDDKGNNSGSAYVFGQPDTHNDLTGDQRVDFFDFNILASHWLQSDCQSPEWCGGADINQDGSVDFYDLQSLVENWLYGMN